MRVPRDLLSARLVVLFAAAVSACSTRGGPAASSRDNFVTREEMTATNARTAYEALGRLRPSWLSSRGPANMGNVRDATEAEANVYMSGSRMGGLDYLRQVYVSDVHEIRFWNAGEAGARFGMGNPRGVIEVIPRR